MISAAVMAAAGAAVSAPHAARAASTAEMSPLERAVGALREARGVEQYAALRNVFRQWDQGDPSDVEEAIVQFQSDTREPAPLRAYAGMIESYARRRRGDLEGSRSGLRALGMVDKWMVVGPFNNEGKEGLARSFPPEEELALPVDPTRAYEGKERAIRWRQVPEVYNFGWLDIGDLIRPREKACAYATTFVRSHDGSPRDASIWAGAAGALRIFWNGAEVLSDNAYRGLDTDRFAVSVKLKKGFNRLTAKVCGDDDPPMLTLRVAGPDGLGDPALEFSADHAASVEAAANATQPAPKARIPAGFGPVQRFEDMVAKDGARPRSLEAYARYLRATGGDDPNLHKALDLVRQAANAEPTVARCVLAAELSEDRNERREWLGRAAALPEFAKKARPLDWLLAQAELARTGTNFRDATPFYDEILTRDPGNVRALLGRVELYREAGLKRTASLTLETALQKNPRSVALLQNYSLLLREVGRSAEADEAADRYAALRFDDGTYMSDRVELATRRHEHAAAERWVDRLLAAEPDSLWALSIAARAYRAFGEQPRALAAYRRALELSPEDVDTLRAEADLFAEAGQKEEQLKTLRQILTLRPQEKDVREYVEHIEPPKPRADEQYAWPKERFMALAKAPPGGYFRRTLRDLTVTTVFSNGLASRFHQVVFQPLTDEAAASAREYAFGYQADSEVVQLRAAKVYRTDGKVDDAIESGDGPADNPELATYTSARAFYVHFPRLGPGDVVELRYRIEDVGERNELAGYFGEVVYLQQPEPVRGAEYVLRAPANRPLFFHASALPGLAKSEALEGDTRVYKFLADDVAPVAMEPTMPPLGEVLGHVYVSTYKTWDQVASFYAGLAADQLVPDEEVRRRVAALTKGLTDPAAKMRAIYDEVVQRTRYVALEFGIYGYKPRPCALTFARGWGDCKDKATLIVTMLKQAGIPASLVLVRTAMRGEFEAEPASLAPFDHAIAYVPSMDLFLDGTAEYTGSNELPAMDRGALALVVDESGKGKLVHLPDAEARATRRSRKIEAWLRPQGGAQLEVHTDTTGALAAEQRQRYHAKGTQRERLQQ
ncbi:MAG TPA: DUF3857 domain-containing protein, partial [Polyangiaceae bacterium]